MLKIFSFLLFTIFFSLHAMAQATAVDVDEMYQTALGEYHRGKFDRCEETLLHMLPSARGMVRVSAYRLLALCSIGESDMTKAQEWVTMLLKVDPYFTPSLDDSQRLKELVEKNKRRGVTITTASQQAESLEESPVPVIVITEDMIQTSGAQTLRDLICLYVPSMTRVEGVEANMCMRGVVGNTQENILIMLDGHRLNSASTNSEAPDFRNSMGKIKQIEILRGPASSLYGNVALMAVVNIITKKGSEIDGAEVGARYGSYRTWGADAVFGKGNLHTDILAWGSVYASKGEAVTVDGTTHYIDGYNRRPAYDMGMKVNWGETKLTFTHQNSKSVPFYNQLTYTPYSYDKYRKIEGNGPGSARTTTHVFIDYNHSWDKWALTTSLYGSMNRTNNYNAVGDSLTAEMTTRMFGLTPQEGELLAMTKENFWFATMNEDYTAGLDINANYDYSIGTQRGSLLFGGQADMYFMDASKCMYGYDDRMSMGETDVFTINDIIGRHAERTFSGYLQLKNYITPRLILNSGIRFDSKERYDKTINTLSPRAALIWKARKDATIKLNYARSFVDAPYLYRANTMSFLIGNNLKEQYNNTVQLTGSKSWTQLHLRTELNLYYNSVRNLCIFSYQQIKTSEESSPYSTADVDVCGAEAIVEYLTPKMYINLNVTYKYPVKMRGYSSYEHKIGNEPAYQMNIVASRKLLDSDRFGNLSLRGNMHLQTAAEMEVNYMTGNTTVYNEHCPAQALVNAGIDYGFKRWHLAVDVYNVFNADYIVGAQLMRWIPAQSTKIMTSLKMKF